MMYQKFGSMELALAAYNAGPGNVSKYKGMPPFAETRKFVRNIMNEYNAQKINPDPAIIKYKNLNSSATADKSATADAILENLPIVSLYGTI